MGSRSLRRKWWTGLASATLIVGLAVPGAIDLPSSSAQTLPARVAVSTFTPALAELGTVNLSNLPGTAGPRQAGTSGPPWRIVDTHAAGYQPKSPSPLAVRPTSSVSTHNVNGETGFIGITGYEQAVANGNLDLEPPDQGLCAGRGYVAEFINDALTISQPDGARLLPVIPSYELFKQPSTAFMSDPRCYYDAATERWFLYEFVVGSSDGTIPSVQFIDVSNTSDPTGTFTVWSIDTTDAGAPNCPCFGDYDVTGADDNGIYIATDEFGVASGYNGAVVYALSKEQLETFAQSGIAPVVYGYRFTHDPFGSPYILSPTTTPQGAKFAPNTEYFVESNSNVSSDHHLMVYALNDTSTLAGVPPSPPKVYRVETSAEGYSFPSDATQAPGPSPLARSVQDPLGQLQADFNAVMQTTYTSGDIYAELDTGTRTNDAAAWFILKPSLNPSAGTFSVSVVHQGYVDVSGASLLYPAIGVTSGGEGYMTFSLSGRSNHPSAAYVDFSPLGAFGSVHLAFAGTGTEDGFTCYSAFLGPTYGGCRWGDYSAAVASGGRVYMATETVAPTARDYLTNWGTYVFSAPPPPPPPAR